tara:strand:+ start:239 stop:436 length:198 start_codon:yes stop_codon:yes gene_type:complete
MTTLSWSTEKTERGFDAVVGGVEPRSGQFDFSSTYKELCRVSCSTRARAKTKAIKMMAELEAQQA